MNAVFTLYRLGFCEQLLERFNVASPSRHTVTVCLCYCYTLSKQMTTKMSANVSQRFAEKDDDAHRLEVFHFTLE